jgi:2'-5' RNA ligase
MTIFYLGPILLRDIGNISQQIRAILANNKCVEFTFQGFLLQPSRKPRMIWAQFRLHQDFTDLVHRVSDVCQPYLLERSKHHAQPIPHVTIARMKLSNNPLDLKTNVMLTNFMAQKAELWSSESGAKGVFYTPLATFSFSKIGN